MARALAFVQFIIICLGVFVLHLLGKLNHPVESAGLIPSLVHFLGRYGLWFVPLPVLWAVVGNLLTARFGEKTANRAGLVLTVLVFVVFAVPLVWSLT